MRIPPDASPAVQQAFRDVQAELNRIGSSFAQNVHLKGKRFTGAGDAVAEDEYVTLRQLRSALRVVEEQLTRAVDDATDTGGGGSTPGAGGDAGGVDDGLGQQGCNSCGLTGHVTAGSPLTAVTAGQIVCGTVNEFIGLTAPAVDDEAREANMEQLLLRLIWHLQQAGFAAGRQRNPSSAISKDKLTVQIDGVMRAYDVFLGVNFDQPLPPRMGQVFPADYIADAGVAD